MLQILVTGLPISCTNSFIKLLVVAGVIRVYVSLSPFALWKRAPSSQSLKLMVWFTILMAKSMNFLAEENQLYLSGT